MMADALRVDRNYNIEYANTIAKLIELRYDQCKDVADLGLRILQLDQALENVHREHALPQALLITMFLNNLGPRFQAFTSNICLEKQLVFSSEEEKQKMTTFNDIMVLPMTYER